MNSIVVFLTVLSLVVVAAAHPEWEEFKSLHQKKYDSPLEESLRKTIFLQNKQMIEEFNANKAEKAGFRMGLNHLSDKTSDEIKQRNGLRMPKEPIRNTIKSQKFFNKLMANSNSMPMPEYVDWHKEGSVTEVKDQGRCGSCWAFATTGVLEGQMKVHNKTMVPLSEQNLLDCSNENGCDGGNMFTALEFIHQENGIEDEADYPYYTRQRDSCDYDQSKSKFTVEGAHVLTLGDEELLKRTIASFGPVAAGIDASLNSFILYKDGIYFDKDCSSTNLDHAVLVVGYGVDEGKDYWLVKNSWGKSWGDNGYMKMARNRKNLCGISTFATIPVF